MNKLKIFLNNKSFMAKYLPLILLEIYLWGGYLIYLYGPWQYPYSRDLLTFCFVFLSHTILATGYIAIIKHAEKKGVLNVNINIQSYSKLIIFINLIIFIPYCLYKTNNFYPPVFESFSNLAVAYANATKIAIENSTSGRSMLFGFSYLFIYSLLHVIYFYWDQLEKKYKYIGLFLIIWYALIEMCSGHNKDIFTYAIVIMILYIIKIMKGYFKGEKKKLIRFSIVTFAIIMTMPIYFYMTMISRNTGTINEIEANGDFTNNLDESFCFKEAEIIDEIGDNNSYVDDELSTTNNAEYVPVADRKAVVVPGVISKELVDEYKKFLETNPNPYYYNKYSYSYIDTDDFIFSILPSKLQFFYVMTTSYLTHGYHGLTIALRLPFDFSYGLGHSMALQDYFHRFTGISIYERTYIYKVNQSGYPLSLNWGTAYPQLASDLSFPGTIVFMGILGMFFALLWIDSIKGENIVSLILITSLAKTFLLFTSWWQAGISGTDVIVSYGMLFVWIFLRVYTSYKNRKINRINA